MCEFKYLYFGEDGYVVHCKRCGHYQVAFMCICITLSEQDFEAFCRIVMKRYEDSMESCAENSKSIIIQTPAEGVCFMLTRAEAKRFVDILDEADTEAKTQSLLMLFNP